MEPVFHVNLDGQRNSAKQVYFILKIFFKPCLEFNAYNLLHNLNKAKLILTVLICIQYFLNTVGLYLPSYSELIVHLAFCVHRSLCVRVRATFACCVRQSVTFRQPLTKFRSAFWHCSLCVCSFYAQRLFWDYINQGTSSYTVSVTECDDGTYGFDCVNNCSGHCLNNSSCEKHNGQCKNGCNPGYTNLLCTERK